MYYHEGEYNRWRRSDPLRVVRSQWGWTQFHSWAGKRKLYEPTEQRTLLMTPPVTIVPVVGLTLMPTGTIPGRDANVVLYDVLASLKMRSAAAKPAWFEGECGNPHTIPPRVPLTHHFPFSQSAHAIKCSICSYLCTALRRDIHHVYLRGSRSLAKQRVRTKPTVMVAEQCGRDTPWCGSREHISERIDEQVVDPLESQDQTLQSTVEQIPDAPVPETVEQLVKLPKTLSQDEIQTVQTMEVPLLQSINKVVAPPCEPECSEDHRGHPVTIH